MKFCETHVNLGENKMTDISDELIDIQTRLAFQEDTINQLNQVIIKQDADIIQLKQQLRVLAKKLDELAYQSSTPAAETVNERPPHY